MGRRIVIYINTAKGNEHMGAYKSVANIMTIEDAIAQGYSELQALRDEMGDSADNMESANEALAATANYQACRDAADALDGFCDDEPNDVHEQLAELKTTVIESVNKRKGRGPSRSVRRDNAIACFQAVIERLEEVIESKEQQVELVNAAKAEDGEVEVKDEVGHNFEELSEELRDHLQNAIDEAEGIDFPGMYG